MTLLPRAASFTSAMVNDRYDDMINPPGLTNGLVTAQVDHDVLAVRCVQAPPLAQGETLTAQLVLDGKLARAYGQAVEVTWRPDRVMRKTTIGDWRIETVTVVPEVAQGLLASITVTNLAGEPREARLGALLASGVTAARRPWLEATPPSASNSLAAVPGRAYLAGGDGQGAWCVQGFAGGSVRDEISGLVETTLSAGPGQSASLAYGLVLGEGLNPGGAVPGELVSRLDALLAAPDAGIAECERAWDKRLAALFEPDPAEFGGVLPTLETTSDALRTLYWWGAMGVAYFRRDNPASVLGRTYDTLMPRYWQSVTFIWDYSLSSLTHAQLDPGVMRRHIEHWVDLDIHSHFGTEWLTGGPVGYWYSVNDYAMTRMVFDYVRFTGDAAILSEEMGRGDSRRPLIEHVIAWALAWQGLRQGSYLADYGGIDNLMECVSTYIHEVASLNAANVWAMRRAADLCELAWLGRQADELRAAADELVPHVLELYRKGEGYFDARYPDGSRVPVGHAYDYNLVGTLIAEDLPATMRDEMAGFFARELRTPNWMRALSARDGNAGFSLRPDHQWNGAYPAWPADAARASARLGHPELVLSWLPGLARTANQGPCGQAHFVDEAADPIDGGARKSPPQFPYLIDWACSSSGAWVELVIGGVFGVDIAADGTVTAAPCVADLDPGAVLRGLRVAGKIYDVHADGRVECRGTGGQDAR